MGFTLKGPVNRGPFRMGPAMCMTALVASINHPDL